MTAITITIFFVIMTLILIGFGRYILHKLKINIFSFLESTVYAFFLGYGFFSLFLFMIGVFSLFTLSGVIIILGIITIIAYSEIKEFLQECKKYIASLYINKVKISHTTLLWVIFVVFVILNITITFFPFTEWDGIAYHLPLAKIFATTHSVEPPSWMFHAQYPQLGEVLFGVGYLSDTQTNAETFVSLILIFFHHLFFIAFYLFVKRVYNATIALYALLIMYTLPEISIYITNPYVDIMTATYQFLAFIMLFYVLFDNKIEKKTAYGLIILAYIFGGITAGIKYTGLFMVLFTVIITGILLILKRFKIKEMIYSTAMGCCLASLFFLPMYIKNMYYTHNPVWPFLTQIFPNTLGLNSELSQAWAMLFGNSVSTINPALLPITMTFKPLYFGSIYGIGPLFLMFIPIACFFLISKKYSFSKKVCKETVFYLITIVLFLAIAYKTYYAYRVVFFSIMLLSIIVAYTIYTINEKFSKIRAIILGVFIIILFSNFFAYLVIYREVIPTFTGEKPINNIVYARIQVAEVDEYINEYTAKDAKILLANDLRGYYINREYVWGDPMTSLLYVNYRAINNSDELYQTFKMLGITHIRISLFPQYNYTYGFTSLYYGEHITKLYNQLFENPKYSKLLCKKNNVLLYEIQ